METNLFQKITGLSAMLLAACFLIKGYNSFSIFLASLFLAVICLTDMLWLKIPNQVNLIPVFISLAYYFPVEGLAGLLHILSGIGLGLALLFIPYLLGAVGAGDVKALAALGAITGGPAIFQIFIYTSLIGGIIGLGFYLLKRNIFKTIKKTFQGISGFIYTKDISFLKPQPTNIRFPYAAAIAYGYFAYIYWGRII